MATATREQVGPTQLAPAPRPVPVSALCCAAALLTWPALLNRYPLLYADSVSYVSDGRGVARALFLHQPGAAASAMRSEFYSLVLLPFHWNVTLWPIVALQAVLTAWVLWLVVRSVRPQGSARFFLALVASLSLLTSASWYVSLVMPDILGPLLYLAIYLLVFARASLTRGETWALSLLAVWAMTAHATHLLLAAGLCALLALCAVLPGRRGAATAGVAHIALLLAIAAAAQLGLHAYLYGEATLNGNRAPYLMARIVADGPGADYLRQNCSTLDWAICSSVGHLPDNDDEFLWAEDGIWASADQPTRQRLLAEEMPLVLATLRAYPRQQAVRSFANFTQQLNDFGVNDFDNNDWMQAALAVTVPSSRASYPRSLQCRYAVPSQFFTTLQRWVVLPSALLLAALVPWLWRRRNTRLLGLTAVVVAICFANAFVTAVLSSSDSRYQARIIWLIPLLGALAACDRSRTLTK